MDVQKTQIVGICLRRARNDAGLTQQELAAELGRPQSFVSKSETGERCLTAYELVSYARALGTTAQQLLGEIEGGLDLWESGSDESGDKAE